jgi:tetraacyldisaccharide 4'-kinase
VSRAVLSPLSRVYGVAVAAKNRAYENRWLKARHLSWPVVSIGNLSVGGSGKTPLTIRLAELLSAAGIAVDVLSRGYGRASRSIEQVDPAGAAERFGDEPLLIARRTGGPVFVGVSRYEAGLLAETESSTQKGTRAVQIHLLDDGFQHRQLARDVEIVVLHRSDFSEQLLPAGRLREPLSALRRADFLALREEDAGFEARLRALNITAPIWWMRRTLTVPHDLTDTFERTVAFCGIARPDEFFSALGKDVNVEFIVAFRDHHRYSHDDIDELVKAAKEVEANAFVTTEKDAVRLDASLLKKLEAAAPVRIVKLEVLLRDEASVIQQLLGKLPKNNNQGP